MSLSLEKEGNNFSLLTQSVRDQMSNLTSLTLSQTFPEIIKTAYNVGAQQLMLSERHLSSVVALPQSHLTKDDFSLWETVWYEKL